MNESAVVADIRARVEVYDFVYNRRHCDVHMAAEGFTVDDAVRAVVYGDVIEETPERNRWLFCGNVPGLKSDRLYRGAWLHVSVEYEDDADIALVTMYWPGAAEWRTERMRR